MRKTIHNAAENHAAYNTPTCRLVQFFVQVPVMSLSNPTPGSAGDYDEDDDIIYKDEF